MSANQAAAIMMIGWTDAMPVWSLPRNGFAGGAAIGPVAAALSRIGEFFRATRGAPASVPQRDDGVLGSSLAPGEQLRSELLTRLRASVELTLSALLLSVAIAVPLGIVASVRPGPWIDHLCRIVATAGVSLPVFFTGLLLVYLLYYLAGWAPAPLGRLDVFNSAPTRWTGFYLVDSLLAGDFATFRAAFAQLILPAATMAIFALAPLARITRAAMLAALSSDFIRTARASGLSRRRVVYVYAFPNAVLPVITTLGMVFSFMLGANVLVEKVFAWPGIGSFAIEALIASDYAPGQGFGLTMALLY